MHNGDSTLDKISNNYTCIKYINRQTMAFLINKFVSI